MKITNANTRVFDSNTNQSQSVSNSVYVENSSDSHSPTSIVSNLMEPVKAKTSYTSTDIVLHSNFIAVEGFDGVGKTTLCKNLIANFKKFANVEPHYCREPGSTEFSEQLRQLMFRYSDTISDMTLILLMTASRCELVHNIINHEAHTKYVISDRYVYSTLAYQGSDNPDIINKIITTHKDYIHTLPRTVIFCHASPDILKQRISSRESNSITEFDKKFFDKAIKIQDLLYKYINTNLFGIKPNVINVNTELNPETMADYIAGTLQAIRKSNSMGMTYDIGESYSPLS